jgi:hypothetical protein
MRRHFHHLQHEGRHNRLPVPLFKKILEPLVYARWMWRKSRRRKWGFVKHQPVDIMGQWAAIHAQDLANWSLQASTRIQPPRLKRGPGGRPAIYRDSRILLMAVVQTAWRKPYGQIVDYVATHGELALELGFDERTISQGQYWERRAALGILPFLFFFLGLVAQLIRLRGITGQE